MPLPSGSRASRTATSGRSAGIRRRASAADADSPTTSMSGSALEQLAQAGAHQLVVVEQEDADRHRHQCAGPRGAGDGTKVPDRPGRPAVSDPRVRPQSETDRTSPPGGPPHEHRAEQHEHPEDDPGRGRVRRLDAGAHRRWSRRAARARRLDVPIVLLCAVEIADAVPMQAFTDTARTALDSAAERCRERARREQRQHRRLVRLAHRGRPRGGAAGRPGRRRHPRPPAGGAGAARIDQHARWSPTPASPVLVVRSSGTADDAPVVVGVDGSTSSTAAVEAAAAEADQHRVGAARGRRACRPWSTRLGFTSGPDAVEIEEAEAYLAEAAAGLHERYPDLVIERVVSQTHPVEALARRCPAGPARRGREPRSGDPAVGAARLGEPRDRCSAQPARSLVVHPATDPRAVGSRAPADEALAGR